MWLLANRKTGKEYPVSDEAYALMKRKGLLPKFTAKQMSPRSVKSPEIIRPPLVKSTPKQKSK